MKSTSFRFIFPTTVTLDMEQGRKVLAAALNGLPGSHALFHYGENGKPLPGGMPMVRMHSKRNTIEVITLGDEMTALFQSFVPQVFAKFFQQFSCIPSVQINNLEVEAKQTEKTFFYIAHSVILDRGLKASAKFEAMTEEERRIKAHGVLVRGLERQADALMIDMPEPPILHATNIVRFHPSVQLISKQDVTHQHGISANIAFYWDAKINGSWAVGGLTSKGHGRVWYANKSSPEGDE